jgi:hypothetical protein
MKSTAKYVCSPRNSTGLQISLSVPKAPSSRWCGSLLAGLTEDTLQLDNEKILATKTDAA